MDFFRFRDPGALRRALVWGVALVLAVGCAETRRPAKRPPAEVTKPDLFPDLSADLERQMQERRRAALARGAELKALGIDPFAAQAVQSRLEDLGIPAIGGCAVEPGRLRRAPALRAHRQLVRDDFRARDPSSSDPRVSRELLARRAVVLLVFVSCTLELQSEHSPAGGFEVRPRGVHFSAFFDTESSWLNPRQRLNASTLQHAQLHFDLADLLAREASRADPDPTAVGQGATLALARDEFALRWAGRMGRIQAELLRFEDQLDRETALGWDTDANRRWARRIGEGLAAVRAAMPGN